MRKIKGWRVNGSTSGGSGGNNDDDYDQGIWAEKWLHLPATFAFRVRGKRTHRCTQSSLMTCRGGCGVREGGANMVRIAVGVGIVVRGRWGVSGRMQRASPSHAARLSHS